MKESFSTHTFTTHVDELSDKEQVYLPESADKELLSEEPGGPLDNLLRVFREMGTSESEIGRYKQALHAYAKTRPHTIGKEEYGGVGFSPRNLYFGTHINFVPGTITIPDFLTGTDFKPRLGRDRKVDVGEFPGGGEDALKKLKEEKPSSLIATPVQKMLARLNRLMYFYHEALHVYQAFEPGDKLNFVKDDFDAHEVIDREKEKEALGKAGPFLFHEEEPEWSKKSLLIDPEPEMEDWSRIHITNNEATMDIMSEQVLRPWLRKNPALLMWLHNTVAMEVEVLRILREKLKSFLEEKDEEKKKEKELNMPPRASLNAVSESLMFLTSLYSSAFENSKDAEEYFTQNSLPKVLGRSVGGTVARVPLFDTSDIWNLLRDTKRMYALKKRLREGKKTQGEVEADLREYSFPSGKTYLRYQGGEELGPITQKGAERVATLLSSAEKAGRDREWIKRILDAITKFVDDNDKEGILRIQKEINDELGLAFIEDDLREMYNGSKYLFLQSDGLNKGYVYRLIVRREVVKKFGYESREMRPFIRAVLFTAPLGFGYREFDIMSGLLTKLDLEESESFFKRRVRTWEEIIKDTSLGIVNLDVTRLHEEDLRHLRAVFDMLREKAGGDEPFEGELIEDQKLQYEIIKTLIELKKRQVGQ